MFDIRPWAYVDGFGLRRGSHAMTKLWGSNHGLQRLKIQLGPRWRGSLVGLNIPSSEVLFVTAFSLVVSTFAGPTTSGDRRQMVFELGRVEWAFSDGEMI
jgi:hypothetical protein